jgi:hypothetical protein
MLQQTTSRTNGSSVNNKMTPTTTTTTTSPSSSTTTTSTITTTTTTKSRINILPLCIIILSAVPTYLFPVVITVKYFNPATGMAMLRCLRDFQHLLSSSLPFVTTINKRPCSLSTVHVGGLIINIIIVGIIMIFGLYDNI